MMKLQYLVNLGAGALLIVPGVALRGQQAGVGVDQALSNTITAIANLAGIGDQIARRDSRGINRIRAATEPALMAPQTRDEFLTRLRQEVSGLQMALDGSLAGTAPPSITQTVARGGGYPGAQPGYQVQHQPRVGSGEPAGTQRPEQSSARPSQQGGPSQSLLEALGLGGRQAEAPRRAKGNETLHFSADPLREGKLLVRADRHVEAIQALLPVQDEPEAAYWIARCLQRLDRDQEAREILRRVLADPTAGIHGVRAQHDLDFLDVRAQLQQRRITPGERR